MKPTTGTSTERSYRVALKSQAARHLAVVRFHAEFAEIGKRVGQALASVHQFLVTRGIRVQGPAVAVYRLLEDGFDIAAGYVVQEPITGADAIEPAELPACEAAVTTHLGSYAELPAAYDAIRDWLNAEGRKPANTMWEEYWSDPSTPPEQTRTDVFWPVEQA